MFRKSGSIVLFDLYKLKESISSNRIDDRWLELFNSEKNVTKFKHLFVQSHTTHTDARLRDFIHTEAIII
jgi:hypothetical protein